MNKDPQKDKEVLEGLSYLGAVSGYVVRGLAIGAVVGAAGTGLAGCFTQRMKGLRRSIGGGVICGAVGAGAGFVKASTDLASWTQHLQETQGDPDSGKFAEKIEAQRSSPDRSPRLPA